MVLYDFEIGKTIEQFRDYIAEETLAISLDRMAAGGSGRGLSWSGELNGVRASLYIAKAS